jgi:DnaK suppressor protein
MRGSIVAAAADAAPRPSLEKPNMLTSHTPPRGLPPRSPHAYRELDDVDDGALPSDAEVLAMPEHEYMNDAQRAFFRARLLALRDAVAERVQATPVEGREAEPMLPDPADQAAVDQENALEWHTRDRDRKLLKKIEAALARIDSGDYGWCEETGDPIGVARLLARPTATLTVEAQARRELRERLYRAS